MRADRVLVDQFLSPVNNCTSGLYVNLINSVSEKKAKYNNGIDKIFIVFQELQTATYWSEVSMSLHGL